MFTLAFVVLAAMLVFGLLTYVIQFAIYAVYIAVHVAMMAARLVFHLACMVFVGLWFVVDPKACRAQLAKVQGLKA